MITKCENCNKKKKCSVFEYNGRMRSRCERCTELEYMNMKTEEIREGLYKKGWEEGKKGITPFMEAIINSK